MLFSFLIKRVAVYTINYFATWPWGATQNSDISNSTLSINILNINDLLLISQKLLFSTHANNIKLEVSSCRNHSLVKSSSWSLYGLTEVLSIIRSVLNEILVYSDFVGWTRAKITGYRLQNLIEALFYLLLVVSVQVHQSKVIQPRTIW